MIYCASELGIFTRQYCIEPEIENRHCFGIKCGGDGGKPGIRPRGFSCPDWPFWKSWLWVLGLSADILALS